MLYYYKDGKRKAGEIGLGVGTVAYTPVKGKYPIHIMNLAHTGSLVKGYTERGNKDAYLWLGNSQLHGVNQYRPGNQNAIGFLFNKMMESGEEILGVSYPNANLQEFLVSVIFLSKQIPFKGIVLPVFYDDMRETGIRNEIKTNSVIEAIHGDSPYYSGLKDIESLKKDSSRGNNTMNDFNGISETLQDYSERYLNNKLEENWNLWKSRPDLRANLFNDLYIWRNMFLGIKPNSIRKMIQGNYQENYTAFKNILAYCRDKKIKLVVYIPPLRNDVAIPYYKTEYTGFKINVEKDCRDAGATFINIEGLVPNQYWGMKKSTNSFSDRLEVDFMHFQEYGHKLIADTIFNTIRKTQLQ